MTVRSTQSTGLLVLGVAAFWTVVVVLFALLLRQPAYLLFATFILPAGALSALMLLRPLTFGFDGQDLVYASRGKEQRVPRGEVTRCALTGRAVVFTNAAGAQLLSLPQQRFKEADVAAVCALADIPMTGLLRPLEKTRRDLGQAKVLFAASIFCVLATIPLTGFSFWAQIVSRDNLAAYEAAPRCEGSKLTSGCRLETQALVTGVEAAKSYTIVHLKLADGTMAGADLPLVDPAPRAGDTVRVEVWRAPTAQLPGLGPWTQVTLMNGQSTRANPALDPNLDTTGATAGFGLFLLMSVGLLLYGVYQLRRARAAVRAAAAATTGVNEPVRPLRPDAPLPR